jgi:hypothetical protein
MTNLTTLPTPKPSLDQDTLGPEVLGVRPWDQMPKEPPRWYFRFERFRRQGAARSILATVKEEEAEAGRPKTTKWPPGAWVRAAKRWSWKTRAEAWDRAELDRLRKQEVEAAEQMRRCHIAAGQAALGLFVDWLEKTKMALQNNEDAGEVLSASDAMKLLSEGVRIERLARGEPDTIQRRQTEGDPQASATVNVGINIGDILAKVREAEREEREQREQLEDQADRPARIPYQPSANRPQGNGRGG